MYLNKEIKKQAAVYSILIICACLVAVTINSVIATEVLCITAFLQIAIYIVTRITFNVFVSSPKKQYCTGKACFNTVSLQATNIKVKSKNFIKRANNIIHASAIGYMGYLLLATI